MTSVKRFLDSSTADRLWKIMAGIALLLSVGLGYAVYRQNQCQADYAAASNASQRARSEAAEQDRQAQDAMFDAIADDPRNAVTTLRAYRDQRRAADEQRARNPIPPPPSTRCG